MPRRDNRDEVYHGTEAARLEASREITMNSESKPLRRDETSAVTMGPAKNPRDECDEVLYGTKAARQHTKSAMTLDTARNPCVETRRARGGFTRRGIRASTCSEQDDMAGAA